MLAQQERWHLQAVVLLAHGGSREACLVQVQLAAFLEAVREACQVLDSMVPAAEHQERLECS